MVEVFAQQQWTVPQAPWWVPMIPPSMALLLAVVVFVLVKSPWRHRRSLSRRDAQHDAMALAVARDRASDLAALRDRQDAETASLLTGEPFHG